MGWISEAWAGRATVPGAADAVAGNSARAATAEAAARVRPANRMIFSLLALTAVRPHASTGNVARLARTCKRKLQPAFAFEVNVRQHRRENHQDQRKRITEEPIELGHVMKIHAV